MHPVPRTDHENLARRSERLDLDLGSGRVWRPAAGASVDRQKPHCVLYQTEERSPVVAGCCVVEFDLYCKVGGRIVLGEKLDSSVEIGEVHLYRKLH